MPNRSLLHRSEREWTRWGDEHPVVAGVMQLGIYALCWLGFIAIFLVIAGFVGLLAEAFS